MSSIRFIVYFCFFALNFHLTCGSVCFNIDSFTKLNISRPVKFKLHDNSSLRFKYANSYEQIVDSCQKKLNKGFEKFFDAVYQEFGFSAQDIVEQLENVKFLNYYHKIQSAKINFCSDDIVFLSEEEMDIVVLKFIQNIIFSHTKKRNIRVVLTNFIDDMATTFGSDVYGHYVFCNMNVYSKSNVDMYYKSLLSDTKISVVVYSHDVMRCIEKPSLMKNALIDIASKIEHQTHMFLFWILCARSSGKPLSKESIDLGICLNYFLNYFYMIMQSTNPLQSALFYCGCFDPNSKEAKISKSFFKQIYNNCSDESVKKFKFWLQKIKTESSV